MASTKFIVKNGLQSDGNVLINKTLDNTIDQLQIDGSTSVTGQIKSTLATGTAPFSVSSTTAHQAARGSSGHSVRRAGQAESPGGGGPASQRSWNGCAFL